MTAADKTPPVDSRQSPPVAEPAKLYLKIFGDLKKEVASFVKDARDTERNTLLYCGAVIAFVSGHCSPNGYTLLAWLPFVFALFGGARVLLLMLDVGPRRAYLKRIEENVLKENLPASPIAGWETFRPTEERFWTAGKSMWLFWILLIITTGSFPILLTKGTLSTAVCKVEDSAVVQHSAPAPLPKNGASRK